MLTRVGLTSVGTEYLRVAVDCTRARLTRGFRSDNGHGIIYAEGQGMKAAQVLSGRRHMRVFTSGFDGRVEVPCGGPL